MAFETYYDLQQSIQGYIVRTDQQEKVKDFIRLAEIQINRDLSTRMTVVDVELTDVNPAGFLTLPLDYLHAKKLWRIADNYELEYRPPEEFPYSTRTFIPCKWTIRGDEVHFDQIRPPDCRIRLRYKKMFRLTDTEPTNFILEKYPDAYFYGTLLVAGTIPSLVDPANLPVWNEAYARAISGIKENEAKINSLLIVQSDIPLRNSHAVY